MAKLPIEIVEIGNVPIGDITQAISVANSLQEEFQYSRMTKVDSQEFTMLAFRKVSTKDFLDNLEEFRKKIRGYHPFILAVIDAELYGEIYGEIYSNLFSDNRPESGLAVITISNVEEIIIPSGKMVAYFMYYFSRYTLGFIVPKHKSHEDTKSCVFDCKIHKLDILLSMKTRSICDNCRSILLQDKNALVPSQLEALDRLFDASGKFLEERTYDVENQKKHRIFIASSTEGLKIARSIQSELTQDFAIEIWNQDTVFGLGTATIEALENAVSQYDFGIFVFTPDDQLHTRGEIISVARDNVIFELGLFIGKLTRFRSFIIHPSKRTISMPSDLIGMKTATYDPDNSNLRAALGPACQEIRNAIKRVETMKNKNPEGFE